MTITHKEPRQLPRLRTRLLALALLSLAPMLLLSLALGFLLLEHEQENFRRAAQDRNQTFMTAIDAQIEGHLKILGALAVSQSLREQEFGDFYEEAKRVLATQADWRNIILVDPQGRQLVNLRYENGAELPMEPESELPAIFEAFTSGRRAISYIPSGPRNGLSLRYPVRIAGDIPYFLESSIRPQSLVEFLRQQAFPQDWVMALVDESGTFIARQPPVPSGARASSDFWNAIQGAREGWFRGRNLEGRDSWTAYMSSPLTGWTVGVAIPVEQVREGAVRLSGLLMLGMLLSLLLALALTYWLARYISRPIVHLAKAARGLEGQGDAASIAAVRRDPRIREVLELSLALEGAVAAMKEREVLQAREQEALLAADKAKDEFLAMLSHELRNPLGAIMTSVEIMRLAKPGEQRLQQIQEIIIRQARQMNRLMQDLLEISKLAMGKLSLQKEDFELAELAATATASWELSKSLEGLRLVKDLSPVSLHGDRARIEQILVNLLDNAEKFSREGGRIFVRVAREGGTAVLEVKDEGQGISEEEMRYIFKPFSQGKQSLERPLGGLGLGLSIVKHFAELHGGSVSVVSPGPGKGACFTVRLPLP